MNLLITGKHVKLVPETGLKYTFQGNTQIGRGETWILPSGQDFT